MNNLIKSIIKVNNLYRNFQKNYSEIEKVFHNHSAILQKIKFSEQILNQAFILIAEKTEEVEQKRVFNKIIKTIKKDS